MPQTNAFRSGSPSTGATPPVALPQYALPISATVLTVLEIGLNRAVVERKVYPDFIRCVDENHGLPAYTLSKYLEKLAMLRRAEALTLEELTGIHRMLFLRLGTGGGSFVGTLHEVYMISGWIENERDLIAHCPTILRGKYVDRYGCLITPEAIISELTALIEKIDNHSLVRVAIPQPTFAKPTHKLRLLNGLKKMWMF